MEGITIAEGTYASSANFKNIAARIKAYDEREAKKKGPTDEELAAFRAHEEHLRVQKEAEEEVERILNSY